MHQHQRVYRISQLATRKGVPGVLPVGPATIWRWTKAGHLPQPFKLGPATTVWDAAEIDAFVAARRKVQPAGGQQ